MMLGTPYTGRLPTTQADIDLLKARISKVKQDLKILDQMVAQGKIDSRAAGYRKQQLTGEIYDLERAISSSRLSTPSYRVPRDLQTFKAKKPAKKLIPESHTDSMPQNYFGTDRRGNHSSITSDWEATAPTIIDVPNLPPQKISRGNWPSHWPGQHSPMIMRAVMETGEINGKQMIDPREPSMMIKVDLVNDSRGMSVALTLKSRYQNLLEIVSTNPMFTVTDRKLVNNIFSKINAQITFAEAEIKRREFTKPKKIIDTRPPQELPYQGQDDTNSGDPTPMPIPSPDTGLPGTGLPGTGLPGSGSGNTSSSNNKSRSKSSYEEERKRFEDMIRQQGQQSTKDSSEYQEDSTASETKEVGAVTYKMSKNTHALRIYFNGKYKYSVVGQAVQKQGSWSSDRKRYYQYKVIEGSPTTQFPKVVFTYMSDKYVTAPMMPKPNWKAPNPSETDLIEAAKKYLATKNLAGFGSISRRTGQLMNLGAMQSHDRHRSIRDNDYIDQATYNQTLREMSMAKARAGARVDITKEIKEQPVTKPWTMQVTLPPEKIASLNMTIDSALSNANQLRLQTDVTQNMFTQQAHNRIATIVNSLSSDMTTTEQTEFVIESLLNEMANDSTLLNTKVSVDYDPSTMGVKVQTQQEQNIQGLGSALLKTKAAMGRLLG